MIEMRRLSGKRKGRGGGRFTGKLPLEVAVYKGRARCAHDSVAWFYFTRSDYVCVAIKLGRSYNPFVCLCVCS